MIERKQNIFSTLACRLFRNAREKKVSSHIYRYKQSLFQKKTSGVSTVIPLILMLIVSVIVYKYLFFAAPVSNSMLPTFVRGDLVLFQTYNTTSEIGDIIMFKVPDIDKPITHRVYSLNDGYIQTAGDNTGVDPWNVPHDIVHAKAVIIRDKPIVVKYVGSFLAGELQSGKENAVFKAMSTILQKGREAGLLIFLICIILYLLVSAYDMSSQRRYKRR